MPHWLKVRISRKSISSNYPLYIFAITLSFVNALSIWNSGKSLKELFDEKI